MMVLVITLGILATASLLAYFALRRAVSDAEHVRLDLDPSQLPGVYYRRALDGHSPVFVAGEVVELTGYTTGQFDAGLARLDELVADEDRARIQRALEEARQQPGGIYGLEYRLRTRLGDLRWVYDRGRVRSGDNGALTCEGFLVDVTPRKLYEQRLREQEALRRREQQELVRIATSPAIVEGRVADAARMINEVAANLLLVERVGLWLLSGDGRTLTAVDLYERTPRRHSSGVSITAGDFPRYFDALRNQRAVDAVDAEHDPRTSEFAGGYLQRFEILSMLDASVRVAGAVRGVICLESVRQRRQWTAEEVSFAGELADQFAACVQNQGRHSDASERKQLEAELIQAQKMEAVGHLTSGIAHDFNNIITAVSGYTSLARQYARRDPDMLNACLSRIDDAIRRSRVLVKQLMKFGASSPVAVTRIDLGEKLVETADFLRSVLPSSVEVETALSPVQLSALFDADQLDQVLLNLALNGADAMEGQGLLHVATAAAQAEGCHCDACGQAFSGSYAVIRLSDTGSGIPEDMRGRVFEPFFTTKGEGRGTGLGLAMVNRLVHEYGGHVSVASEPGRGTTFTLFLPLADAPEASLSVGGGVAPVLVVDDDVGAGSFLAELLLSRGYRVQTQTSPTEALRLVREQPGAIRLVITDYSMPEMDGMTLARQIHEADPGLPVLLVSGYGADINLDDFGDHGVRAMFGKPIETERLLAAVREALAEKTMA